MERILAATDFSARSDRALRRAVLLARSHEAVLSLVHVVDDDQPAYLVDRHQLAASELLQKAAETISQMDGLTTDVQIRLGEPFNGILGAADDTDADLILVGPHRRQFLDTFTGTTAERTIRRSQRPVLMVNAMPAAPYSTSLLAVDFDDASRSAARIAQQFGIFRKTDTIAFHLFDAMATGMMKRASEPEEAVDHYLKSEQEQAAEKLQALLAEAGIEPSRIVLRPLQGSPAGGILSAAQDENAELIVIGTNQRKGLSRLLLGSVAQMVLLDAERDVLVVPAGQNAAQSPTKMTGQG